MKANSIVYKAGWVLVGVFHPLLLFFYCFTALAPKGTDINGYLLILAGTVVLPGIIGYLWAKNLHMPDRKSRTLPLLLGSLCYALTWFVLSDVSMGNFSIQDMRRFDFLYIILLGQVLGLLLLSIANLFLKVSLHAFGIAYFFVVVVFAATLGWLDLSFVLIYSLVGLLVVAQRIYSNSHTWKELLVGLGLGLVLGILAITFADTFLFL